MLYIDYEHITFISASQGNKKYTSEDFTKAINADAKTDYKCKGMARK